MLWHITGESVTFGKTMIILRHISQKSLILLNSSILFMKAVAETFRPHFLLRLRIYTTRQQIIFWDELTSKKLFLIYIPKRMKFAERRGRRSLQSDVIPSVVGEGFPLPPDNVQRFFDSLHSLRMTNGVKYHLLKCMKFAAFIGR